MICSRMLAELEARQREDQVHSQEADANTLRRLKAKQVLKWALQLSNLNP